ncbi:Cytochrome P450, conserved site [Trema orientale]|uniref:Cytochrome P450, conserved site n=1 Tax=Trema orientale TaxID=63057 RepID=A0A2P5FMY4_TREOI|nr:Cytochrome P450, conserved site [Trema orientale]
MSFGAGKRACAGLFQAMLITCTTIGRLPSPDYPCPDAIITGYPRTP